MTLDRDRSQVPSPVSPPSVAHSTPQELAPESEGTAIDTGSETGIIEAASQPLSTARRIDVGMHHEEDRPMTGIITDLRPGGFGYIAAASYGKPWHLSFRSSAVIDDGFATLRIGQRVRFDLEPTPGGRGDHAVRIVPLT